MRPSRSSTARSLAVALALAAISACKPDVSPGHFACDTDWDCPERWSCWSDRRCYDTPEPPTRLDAEVSERPDASPGDTVALDAATPDRVDAAAESKDGAPLDVGALEDSGLPRAPTGLAQLELTPGWLTPEFDSERLEYAALLPSGVDAVRFVARPTDDAASVSISGYPAPSGAPSQEFFVVPGASALSVVVSNGGETRTYRVRFLESPVLSSALRHPDPPSPSHFGQPVAQSGDTVVVGAPVENGTRAEGEQSVELIASGAAYVFRRTASGWALEAVLQAPNARSYDVFGAALAIDGDTIVVGAPQESSGARGVGEPVVDGSAPASGAAYVFQRDGDVWGPAAYLKASNAAEGGRFGVSVAIHQDTIVVGSPGDGHASEGPYADDGGAPNSGALFVFSRVSGLWTQDARLKAHWVQGDDQLGSAVAVHGDRVASGSMWESGGGAGIDSDPAQRGAPESGAVHVFARGTAGSWSLEAYLKPSHPDAGDHFGRSLSLLGDTLAVGAPGDAGGGWGVEADPGDDSRPFSGAVHLFVRGASGWAPAAYLKPLLPSQVQGFGVSVALGPDLILVGTQSPGAFPGAVDLFRRSSSAWAPAGSLIPSAYLEGFGASVAVSPGRSAVGAPSPVQGAVLMADVP